nr:uncharacterized protein LOC117683038 [Crassostrea gigas]
MKLIFQIDLFALVAYYMVLITAALRCFSAVLSNGIYLGDHQAIKYGRVLTYYGNGYGKCSGHFKAPLKGLYMFSCTIMAKNGHDVSVAIVKNDQNMMLAY